MDRKTLKNCRAMKFEMEQLDELILRVDARRKESKIARLTQTPKGKGTASSPVENDTAQWDFLKSIYEQRREMLAKTCIEVENLIDKLEPTERMLMRYRYIDALSWRKVAQKIHYEEQSARNLHNKILKSLFEK